MAKKGNVKRGFATYLMILILAIIATFLVIITVMLFSPFKNILGFKYFIHDDLVIKYNATGDAESDYFNFDTIKNININCNYANVNIERYFKTESSAIMFENKTSGFAREDQNTDFVYEVYYSDPSTKENLNITVHEPEGFVYFNKGISINLIVPSTNEFNDTLNNTTINITNTSGSTYIGTSYRVQSVVGQEDANYLSVKNLNVKSTSGSIYFMQFASPNINNLFIKTGGGEVVSKIDLTVNDSLKIYANGGNLMFKNLTYNGSQSATLDIGNSKFTATDFVGNIDFSADNGYLTLNNLSGGISSNDAVEQMSNATLDIKKISGSISLPFANGSTIKIGEVAEGSQVYVHSTSGGVTIDKCYGQAWIETTSGNVNVHTYANDIEVITKSGNINVTYENLSINDSLLFSTTSGEINLKVGSALAFVFEVYNNSGEVRDSNINVAWLGKEIVNPLTVNGGTKMITVISNAKVTLSLIEMD